MTKSENTRPQKIYVYLGSRIVDLCDESTVRRYIGAPNAEIVRKRKTGMIVQVNLSEAVADEAKLEGKARVEEIRALLDSTEGVLLDRRTSTREGIAFEQTLPCGSVLWALGGLSGS